MFDGSKPENSGSSAKQPMPKGVAATSSIVTRLLGFHAADMERDVLGPVELQDRMHAVFPSEAATKLENGKKVFNKFDGIKENIAAIQVGHYVVTVSDYEKVSKVLYRVVMDSASGPVCLTAATIQRQNGFELLQRMLVEYA